MNLRNIQDLNFLPYEESGPSAPQVLNLEPEINPMMRCPLPPISVSPDSLRQFYRGGQLPQTRLLNPPPFMINGALASGGGTSVVSSSSGVVANKLQILQTAITTTQLIPNKSFIGLISLGKAFQLLQIATSSPARVELYGSLNALQLDASRGIDVAPAYGTEQGLIMDIVLDQNPFNFVLEGVNGSNNDQPQTTFGYISITNLSSAILAITATFLYLPFVSQ